MKKILLAVTGGIAAYKAIDLTSKLTQSGYEVRVMLTNHAQKFVTPLAFQAISRNAVYTDTFIEENPSEIQHIALGDWADAIIVAPATANTIAKLSVGIADDLVTSTLLATETPKFIAPAMNVHMYENKIVQKNMMTLKTLGYTFIEPGEGFLACGYVAKGRLEEPEAIIARLEEAFSEQKPLQGKRILITAGPTREKIDPVRFMTNFSSGKMGYAIAEVAANLGAEVILVSGPTALNPPLHVTTVQVESAQDMLEAVIQHYQNVDVVIKTAAVADYRPKYVHDNKMKKKNGDAVIELERTVDILKTLGEMKDKQLLIGFAAETTNVKEYATKKLREKNANMIVANDVKAQGAGFGTDTNIVTMYRKDGEVIELPLLTKKEVAREILKQIEMMLEDDRL